MSKSSYLGISITCTPDECLDQIPQKTHSHRPVMPVDFVVFFNVQDCDALKRFPVVCFLKFNVHLNETKFERNSAVFQV